MTAPFCSYSGVRPSLNIGVNRGGRRWRCNLPMGASRRDLEGEHVIVVGLGVSGRAACKLALDRGARITAVDSNDKVKFCIPLFSEHLGSKSHCTQLYELLVSFAERDLLQIDVGAWQRDLGMYDARFELNMCSPQTLQDASRMVGPHSTCASFACIITL